MSQNLTQISAPHLALAQQVPDDSCAPWANPWAVFWRRKAIILSVFTLGCLITFVCWRSTPEIYHASAQLLLIAGTGSEEQVVPNSSVQARMKSHMEQLKSPLVLKRIVKQVFKASFPDDQTAAVVHERLKLEPNENLLKMTFSAASADLCQTQLSEIISGYQGYLHFTPQSNHAEAIARLEREIDQCKQTLTAYELSRTELLRSTPFAGSHRDIHDQIDARLQKLNEQRQRLQIQQAELQRALADQPSTFDGRTAQSSGLPAQELSKAAARELYTREIHQRQIAARARTHRPELQRAEQATDQARQLFSELGQSTILNNDLKEVENSILALDRLLIDERRQAEQWTETASKAKQLQNTINQQQVALSTLQRKLQRRTLAVELETCQLQVIAPPKPGTPRSLRDILLHVVFPGVFGSLLFGIIMGIGLEFLDRGFHSPAEISRTVGARLTGEIPFLTLDEAEQEHSAVGGLVANYKISHAEFADQFRRIRTNLFNHTHGNRGEIVLLTSANSRDGMTVCSSNLAAAIAQAGKRVLLIDTNMRQPKQHELFGMSNRTGLSDILTYCACWQKIVQPTLLADVDLLTSGQPAGSPTELYSSPHWTEFLESVRTCYDYLILDSAAMRENLDPCVLARSAKQILMLLKVGKTSRSDAQYIQQELGEMSQKISGVIVNNAHNRRRVWHTDPWETYRNMHTQSYASRSHTLHTASTSRLSDTEKIRAANLQLANSTNSEEIELQKLTDLLQELTSDARRTTHSSQEIQSPSTTSKLP